MLRRRRAARSASSTPSPAPARSRRLPRWLPGGAAAFLATAFLPSGRGIAAAVLLALAVLAITPLTRRRILHAYRAHRIAHHAFAVHEDGRRPRLIWEPFVLGLTPTMRLRVPYRVPGPMMPNPAEFWSRFAAKLEHATATEWVVAHPPGRRWALLTLAPPLPTQVDYPSDLDHEADPWRFPIGVHRDNQGRLAPVRVALDQGHLAVAGATGTGKSGLLYGLVYHALAAAQADLWLADAKRSTFVGQLATQLATHPRVRALVNDPRDPDAYFNMLLAVHRDMQDRYLERDQRGEQTMQGVLHRRGHAFVLLEEATELALIFKGRPKRKVADDPPDTDAFLAVLGSLLRLGREAGVHIIVSGQQINHAILPTELRQNFVARISGWQEPTGANMLGLPEAAQLPLDPEGRPLAGRVVVAGNTTRIVQSYHCPPGRLTTLLQVGRAAPVRLGAPAPARAPSSPAPPNSADALPAAPSPTSAPSPAASRRTGAARPTGGSDERGNGAENGADG